MLCMARGANRRSKNPPIPLASFQVVEMRTREVTLALKRHATRAGLDPGELAGHSLRAGLAPSAAATGVPERIIAEQTGHKGTVMLRRYIREGSLFRENAASAVGL